MIVSKERMMTANSGAGVDCTDGIGSGIGDPDGRMGQPRFPLT